MKKFAVMSMMLVGMMFSAGSVAADDDDCCHKKCPPKNKDKYEKGYKAGKQCCIDNPAACGIDIVNAVYTYDYDDGYETGKQFCIDNPEECGWSSEGGFSQADIDAAKEEAYDEGYAKGVVDGKATCEDDIVCEEVITYAKLPNVDCWVMFPTPCDVPEGWEATNEEPENMCGPTNCEQVVTYAKLPNADCWVMFPTPCDVPEGWEATNEEPENMCGPTNCPETPPVSNDNCATFDIFTNTFNIPCFKAGAASYRLGWELTGSDPITLELKDVGAHE